MIGLDYPFWGWVDVSPDLMPRIFRPDGKERIYYALGSRGNGLMYSAQAGRRMAQTIPGKGQGLHLPIFTSQLPRHEILTPLRRIGQRVMYQWYAYKDESR